MLNHHKKIFIPTESLFIIDYLKYGSELPFNTKKKLIFNEPQLKIWFNNFENINEYDFENISVLFEKMHEIEMKKRNKIIWGQKTPRFIRSYKTLKHYFHNIKFINIIRDPRAVVNSFKNSQSHNSYIPHIIKRWKNDVNHGINLQDSDPNNCLTIKYEDLIESPEQTLQDICNFLNIEYDPNMLSYNKTGLADYHILTSTTQQHLKSKPNKNRIDSWKKSLKAPEIIQIERNTSELMKRFNYQPINKNINSTKKNKCFLIIELFFWTPIIFRYLYYWPQELFHVLKRKLILSYFNRSLKPFIN
jgi:hypothetical protein